ncbi:hypothetical protein K457DRAFT_25930 [Linnemannia elongata AG-77]|uniref:Uncharacterized protein n=1 Tax=Linnemannia elongata AG-77 TaxID=1314771 RepID=A0A197JBS9_9FUNG|nr:hypothetical protein K457DRAFT_25930 [Linnemannia elongata AG-77]
MTTAEKPTVLIVGAGLGGLTNLLYALPSKTTTDIQQILSEYQEERRPLALATFKSSRMLSQVLRKDFYG